MNEELISLAIDYIRGIKKAETEAEKRDLFTNFVRKLIPEKKLSIKLERALRVSGLFVGRADLSVGGVIFEFKRDIKNLSNHYKAIYQLKKYLERDELEEKTTFGIITDGINFEVYDKEDLTEPIETFSFPLEEENVDEIKKVLYKLDKYLLTEERYELNSRNIISFFGYDSLAFKDTYGKLINLWKEIEDKKEAKLMLNEWKIYMEFVYGKELEEDLFFRHTYLSILVKVLASKILEIGGDIPSILNGKAFERVGIRNYIERDFFSWIFLEEVKRDVEEIAHELLTIFNSKFEFKELNEEVEEDLLKELYQNIVSKSERKLLGEYYTPDWLVELILEEVFKDKKAKVLDPSCGSGSFLFFAIKRKKELSFSSPSEKLKHILDSVVGIDVNPVAVLIARTNYLIAIKDLLRERDFEIYIPVYTADSLMAFLKERSDIFENYINVKVNDLSLDVPKSETPEEVDKLIEIAFEFLYSKGDFEEFLKLNYSEIYSKLGKNGVKTLLKFVKQLEELIKIKGNTIWKFILKNIYKPLFLVNSFDLIVGNPPWIVYNKMNTQLQEFVNEFLKKFDAKIGGHLKSHIELATIFFVISLENYLKENGIIAFVMPHSVMDGDQNSWFRKGKLYEFLKIIDLEEVNPLFNTSSCVVIAKKVRNEMTREIPALKVSGKLPKRNLPLGEAQKYLNTENKTIYLVEYKDKNYWLYEGKSISKKSEYAKLFREGATIVPRAFWLVEIDPNASKFGYPKNAVPVISRDLGDEKLRVKIEGSIPERFFYKTILSKRVFPFGYTYEDDVILPLEVADKGQEVIKEIKERFKNIKELIEEEEYGDAQGYLFNTLFSIENYLKDPEISIEVKEEIIKILSENEEVFEEFEYSLGEILKNFEISKTSKPKKAYKLLDYYEVAYECEECKNDASKRFYYWIENSKKLPENFKRWLIKCQKIWEKERKSKAKAHNIIDWLNYRNKLTSQPVEGGYLVLYTTSGTNPASCVVENRKDFVVDTKTYYAHIYEIDEALYLCGFINSNVLSERIKSRQSKGLYGERDIHKLIVEEPIPKYNPSDKNHKKLVEITKKCIEKAQKVKEFLKNTHPNQIRSKGRWFFERELYEIDKIVKEILKDKNTPLKNPDKFVIFTELGENALRKKLKKLKVNFKIYPVEELKVKYEVKENFKSGAEVEGIQNKEIVEKELKKEKVNFSLFTFH